MQSQIKTTILRDRTRLFWLRPAVTVALVLAALWMLKARIEPLDFGVIWQSVVSVSASDWALAALLTGLSFWAVGRYDGAVHKMLATGLPDSEARGAGRAAIAISQAVGFGLVSGAFVRWQWGRGAVSALLAAKTTAIVGFCFLSCAALWALLFAPLTALPFATFGPVLALGLMAALVWASLRLTHRFPLLPPVQTMLRLMGLTALDLGCAALAFWVLLPSPELVSPLVLAVVYTAALFLALVSNAPGGVGPFDMAMLVLLPMVPQVDLLATCIAFRIVYYALPACLAAFGLMLRLVRLPDQPCGRAKTVPALSPDLDRAANAELRLAESPGHTPQIGFARSGPATLALADLSQSQIALFDPICPASAQSASTCPAATLPAVLRSFAAQAAAADKFPALYKCSARTAATARTMGWSTLRIAEDAIIDPARFSPSAARCRQLRRKMRKATKAGLRVEAARGTLPLAQIAAVDAAWSARHGTPRGFSMSRPGAVDLAAQRVFLIWQGDALQGYCSFHQTGRAWALDLMPQHPDAPDGAMHLAIAHALEHAKQLGVERVSLTAVPNHSARAHPLWARALQRLTERLDNPGLRQFKASFDPDWHPLYMVAPSRMALFLAGLEICDRIAKPAADPTSKFHDLYEGYAFASYSRPMA